MDTEIIDVKDDAVYSLDLTNSRSTFLNAETLELAFSTSTLYKLLRQRFFANNELFELQLEELILDNVNKLYALIHTPKIFASEPIINLIKSGRQSRVMPYRDVIDYIIDNFKFDLSLQLMELICRCCKDYTVLASFIPMVKGIIFETCLKIMIDPDNDELVEAVNSFFAVSFSDPGL